MKLKKDQWVSDMHIDLAIQYVYKSNFAVRDKKCAYCPLSLQFMAKHGRCITNSDIDMVFLVLCDKNHWVVLTNMNFSQAPMTAEGDQESVKQIVSLEEESEKQIWRVERRLQWYIYDSLYDTQHAQSARVVLKMLFPEEIGWPVEMIRVQQQKGYNDCGLFAIGTLIALWNDVDPTTIVYRQSEMRNNFNDFIDSKMLILAFRHDIQPASSIKERVFVEFD